MTPAAAPTRDDSVVRRPRGPRARTARSDSPARAVRRPASGRPTAPPAPSITCERRVEERWRRNRAANVGPAPGLAARPRAARSGDDSVVRVGVVSLRVPAATRTFAEPSRRAGRTGPPSPRGGRRTEKPPDLAPASPNGPTALHCTLRSDSTRAAAMPPQVAQPQRVAVVSPGREPSASPPSPSSFARGCLGSWRCEAPKPAPRAILGRGAKTHPRPATGSTTAHVGAWSLPRPRRRDRRA